MDTLFLGVSHVIPCCVLWFSCRIPTGAQVLKEQGETVYRFMVEDLKADTSQLHMK